MIYTVKQATEYLGYANESYVRKLILNGKIKAKKLADVNIITKTELNRFISRRDRRD